MSKDEDKSDVAAAFFGTPFLLLLLSPLLFGMVCAGGFAFAKVWMWHIAPLGLPPVSWTQAAGGFLLVSLIRNTAVAAKDERSTKEKFAALAAYFCWPWLMLLMGWVLT